MLAVFGGGVFIWVGGRQTIKVTTNLHIESVLMFDKVWVFGSIVYGEVKTPSKHVLAPPIIGGPPQSCNIADVVIAPGKYLSLLVI